MKKKTRFRMLFTGPAFLGAFFLSGCATSTPPGSARAAVQRPAAEQIRWPAEYAPEQAAFFVHNQIEIEAPVEIVWDIITNVAAWSDWYSGASDVVVPSPDGRVRPGDVVSWKTMGLKFDSHVKEFEPPYRFAWESRKSVIQGYHAWLIGPTENGVRVITDESFQGFLADMQRVFQPNKLHGLHQEFLEQLKVLAEARAAAEGGMMLNR